jgi:hypothetical protein
MVISDRLLIPLVHVATALGLHPPGLIARRAEEDAAGVQQFADWEIDHQDQNQE